MCVVRGPEEEQVGVMSYVIEHIGVVIVYMQYMVYNYVYYCDTCYMGQGAGGGSGRCVWGS
jgi:hypothetical protein